MMKALKLLLFRCYVAIYRHIARWQGLEVHPSSIINKKPDVRKAKGSRIILHEDTTLTSNPRHNPLLLHPVIIRTLTPNAVIEMKKGSGMSGASLICCNRITIGEHTIIGPNTLIYDSEGHSYTPEIGWKGRVTRTGRPINIGAKCFIGSSCIIMSGVTIGDNCVLSAGTVLKCDVPAGHMACGNPAVISPLPKILGGPGRKKTPTPQAS